MRPVEKESIDGNQCKVHNGRTMEQLRHLLCAKKEKEKREINSNTKIHDNNNNNDKKDPKQEKEIKETTETSESERICCDRDLIPFSSIKEKKEADGLDKKNVDLDHNIEKEGKKSHVRGDGNFIYHIYMKQEE